MGTTTCAQCGEPAPSGARRCANCGAGLGTRPRGTGNYRFDVGEMIDNRYEIVELLPGGGMGELYRVRHVHLHDDRVIKLLRSDQLVDETQRKRFSQEARIAASIKHPNVAIMHDFASLSDGTFYMVEEFVDGTTISRTIRSGRRFSLSEVTDIARQVLMGLAAIHEKGIIHRDISPDNILLFQTTTGLRVKIIDLGIAKPIAGASGQALTSAGLFIGKPHYASPEQMQLIETDRVIDHRTDLYSLGVVLYEMIVGRVPFEAATPLAYLIKQASEEVKTVNRDLSAVVPPDLDAFIVRLLKTNREERFSSALEALQELDSTGLQLPTLVQPLPACTPQTEARQSFPLSTPPPRRSTDEIPFDQLEAMVLEDRTTSDHTRFPLDSSSILITNGDDVPTEVRAIDEHARPTEQIQRPGVVVVAPAPIPIETPQPATPAPSALEFPAVPTRAVRLDKEPLSRRTSSRTLQLAIGIPVFAIIVSVGGYLFFRWLDARFGSTDIASASSANTATAPLPTTAPTPPIETTTAAQPVTQATMLPDTTAVPALPRPEPTAGPEATRRTTRKPKPATAPVPTDTAAPASATDTVAAEPVEPPVPATREGQTVAPGPGVIEPRPLKRATPIFPPTMQTLRGRKPYILFSVLVGPDGRVEIAKPISGSGYEVLDKLAEEAARNSTFTPATKDGVNVRMWRTMRFDLK